MLLAVSFLAAVMVTHQAGQDPPTDPPVSKQVTATRAAQSPVIDGRDDDAVWKQATPITSFQEWRPSEGGQPKLPTEAKVAFDAGNLYVFVRAFDPHPDSVVKMLERRDSWTPSDMIWIFVDSYHDRFPWLDGRVPDSDVADAVQPGQVAHLLLHDRPRHLSLQRARELAEVQ